MAPAIPTTDTPIISNPKEAERVAVRLSGILLSMDRYSGDPKAQVALAFHGILTLIKETAHNAADIERALETLARLNRASDWEQSTVMRNAH